MPNPPTAYAQLDAHARALLRRHRLTERQRLIVEIVLDWSFAKGRRDALIPYQWAFVALTGISKGNVSQILLELDRAGVLLIDRPAGRYTFNVDATIWRRVDCRLSSAEAIDAAGQVEAWLDRLAAADPTQLDLIEPPFDLTAALARDAVGDTLAHFARANRSHRGDDGGRQSPIPAPSGDGEPAPSGLVDSSTGPDASSFADDELARLMAGGASLSDLVARSLEQFPIPELPVPESGTPHIDALNGSSSSHLDAIKCAVPESGTRLPGPAAPRFPVPAPPGHPGGETPGVRRRLDREEELLREIEQLGARYVARGPRKGADYGGFWRTRIREDRAAMVDAVGELKLRVHHPRLAALREPGAYLRDRYNRFHAEGLGAQKQ